MRNSSKLYDAHAEYIDPGNCGSMVGYKVSKTNYTTYSYIDASVNLSDCNRFIQWEFGFRSNRPHRYAESLRKIDQVLAVFYKFRAALESAKPKARSRKKK